MTRQQLKAMAKEQIKGNIGILFLIMLIIAVISGVASTVCAVIPVVGPFIPVIIITPAFAISTIRVYQGLAIGKKPQASDAFSGFDDFWSAFKAFLLVGIYTFLWSLLFIIPGIIKSFSYSQTMYIVAENPGIGAKEAINRSKKMMEGHKFDLFVLALSFIGWYILAGFTFGILCIWLIPYVNATLINFYNSIKPVAQDPNAECAEDAQPATDAVSE